MHPSALSAAATTFFSEFSSQDSVNPALVQKFCSESMRQESLLETE